MMRIILLCTVLAIMASGIAGAAENFTYVDLVNRMMDMEAVAVLPEANETCQQWSSYDRASYYDEATGKYMGWDANGDNHGLIRREGDLEVMAEMDGPGVIWRIWSAHAAEGHVKIYLDGADEPAVDLPFAGYFDGKNEPFVYPSLVYHASQGKNNYIPIPYQKSCKIVADSGWGAYYQFVYTTFPEGTRVPTFTRDLSPQDRAALSRVDRFLRVQRGMDPAGKRWGDRTEVRRVNLGAGEKSSVKLEGTRAITGLWIKPDASNDESTLRDVVLQMKWDGEKTPSVWVPVGDFFGGGPGLNYYRSLPMGVTENGFYSYWYMPFAKSAVVQLVNDGKAGFKADVILTHAPLTKPIGTLGRFHAKWHRDAFLPPEPERWIDWTILTTQGKGRYTGVALEIWNPKGSWWGEGDEKFHLDGEKFPSTIGTGSEDYFGYAWCDPNPFERAFHNQPRNSRNIGHISNNRWHIMDNIPFRKSFDGYIEKYFLNDRPTLYAATAYWYLEPEGVDPYTPVAVKDRRFYVTAEPFKVKGAIEGETLKLISMSGGETHGQMLHERWSDECHLWWISAKPGDKLELALPVAKKGKYELIVALTKARDYGIHQLYLDGKKLGGPIDLYDPHVVPTGEISLGVMDLAAGERTLTVEILGANEKAIKEYMFGLDYVKLVKAN